MFIGAYILDEVVSMWRGVRKANLVVGVRDHLTVIFKMICAARREGQAALRVSSSVLAKPPKPPEPSELSELRTSFVLLR